MFNHTVAIPAGASLPFSHVAIAVVLLVVVVAVVVWFVKKMKAPK